MATILVVDDEEIVRNPVSEALLAAGHTVLQAANGREAQEIVFRESIDLCVSDVMMPEMDGFEFLNRVRFVNPHVKFIIMTGFHKPENIPACLAQNVSRYMPKPFALQEIIQVVEAVLAEGETQKVIASAADTQGWLEMEISSSEKSLLRAEQYVQQYLLDLVPTKANSRIVMAFHEMVQNAMEWGNALNQELCVKVSCMALSDRVVFKVEDQGQGFDVTKAFVVIPDPFERQDNRARQGKRPGGYGIEMTRKSMDEFFYNERGNCLIMTKMIEKENGGPL